MSNEQHPKWEAGIERYPQKETMGTNSLEGLAEVLKLMSKVGALQKKAKRQEAAKAARMPGRKSWPNSEETKQLRADLDDVGLAFRVYGTKARPPDGWMRAVRQAIGVPVVELARRMGVKKSQIFRLEESERDGRVRMATLRRAAEAMGCELVYALVPREGKLASMAAEQRAEMEQMAVPFEMVRKHFHGVKGWLRAIRQKDARAAREIAGRLGVLKREVLRLEVAEASGQITLGRLREVADATEREVVYAFLPKETTLEELAQREMARKKEARLERVRRRNRREIDRRYKRYGKLDTLTLLALEVRRGLKKHGIKLEELGR